MASRFNIVGKANVKKENTEEELEETRKVIDKNKALKKMFLFMGIIVGILCVILLVLFISSLFVKRTYTYDEIEKIIKDATVSYFKEHSDLLPHVEGGIVEIEVDNLVAAEKMKSLSEYTKEGVSCTGKTLVEKTESDYLYTPYLDCGNAFMTQELYKKVTENVVNSGYGLYKLNNEYVYRGENVNNYVKLDEGLWRIVKVATNNRIMLIKELSVGNSLAWDNRYNSQVGYNAGINNYQASRVKEYIEKIYTKPDKNLQEIFLSDSDKEKIVAANLCTGKRSVEETDNSGNIECSQIINNQRVGLLMASDYINASIDPNCKAIENNACQNYNYLKEDYSWWLVTADKNSTDKVYNIDSNGRIILGGAMNYAYVRPVVYLNNKVLYKKGTGSKDKPFEIK